MTSKETKELLKDILLDIDSLVDDERSPYGASYNMALADVAVTIQSRLELIAGEAMNQGVPLITSSYLGSFEEENKEFCRTFDPYRDYQEAKWIYVLKSIRTKVVDIFK